jgi:hypothetical protein
MAAERGRSAASSIPWILEFRKESMKERFAATDRGLR